MAESCVLKCPEWFHCSSFWKCCFMCDHCRMCALEPDLLAVLGHVPTAEEDQEAAINNIIRSFTVGVLAALCGHN